MGQFEIPSYIKEKTTRKEDEARKLEELNERVLRQEKEKMEEYNEKDTRGE